MHTSSGWGQYRLFRLMTFLSTWYQTCTSQNDTIYGSSCEKIIATQTSSKWNQFVDLIITQTLTKEEVKSISTTCTDRSYEAHSPCTVPYNTSSLCHVLLLFSSHERHSYPNPNCNTKPLPFSYEALLITVEHCTAFNAPTNITSDNVKDVNYMT